MKTAIIGGGVAGLAAAYELEKARAAGADVGYSLFESSARLGGVLASEVGNGIVLERGPDSFLTEKPATAELCRELGLGADLIPSNDAARKTYIVVKNLLVPLPDGLMFLVPTKLLPTAFTRLFSLKTKLRMGLELLQRPRVHGGDESVAELVARHYGQEAVDRLADPLLSGIYGGDASQLSARSVLPRFVEMESKYGSLTRGMLATRRAMLGQAKGADRSGAGMQAPVRTVFTSLRGGMQQLTDALAARLDPASVHCSTQVTGIERSSDGWRVEADRASKQRYDALIVAAPAWSAAELMRPVDDELGEQLGQVPYSSSITINLVFDKNQMVLLPEGFGFLVPSSEGRAMLACTFAHRKFAGRAPVGKAVLRAFVGGIRNERLLNESDEALIATVRRELKEILGIAAVPEHVTVSRWRRAMAQYAVGHQERIARISARVATLPGLRMVGNAYDGIGISDCIRLGRTAARDLIATSERALQTTA